MRTAFVFLAFCTAAATGARAESLSECIAALRPERPPELRAETFDRWTAQATDLRPTITTATASQPHSARRTVRSR